MPFIQHDQPIQTLATDAAISRSQTAFACGARTGVLRTHLSLDEDAPIPRPIMPASGGAVVAAVPEVGGLHHRYEHRPA